MAVHIHGAKKSDGPATLIATTKSKANSWERKAVSLRGADSAYFCALIGARFSTTIRVPKRSTAASIPRGDIVRCPR